MSDSHAEVQPPAKKRRAANFSEEELMLLIEEVAERKAVLLGPLTSVVTNKGKEFAWKTVAEAINSVGVVQRNVSDIKKKWFKVKSEVKCKAAKEKSERSKTGGGVAEPTVWKPTEEALLALIENRPQPSTSAVYRQRTRTLVTPVEHISPQPQSNEPQPSTSSEVMERCLPRIASALEHLAEARGRHQAKKFVSDQKKKFYRTGGGPPSPDIKPDAVIEKILALIADELEPAPNYNDSDSWPRGADVTDMYFDEVGEQTSEPMTEEPSTAHMAPASLIPVEGNDHSPLPSTLSVTLFGSTPLPSTSREAPGTVAFTHSSSNQRGNGRNLLPPGSDYPLETIYLQATCPTASQTVLPASEALPAIETAKANLPHSPETAPQVHPEGPAAVSRERTGLQALPEAQELPPLPEGPLHLRVPLWAASRGGQQPGPPTAGQQG
ncbi:hypothetical protein Pcinc_018602 [Petrolisthes cinctipes]|uniref:Regulatory protein zeste n=1 Tax=Petrolisthes cinctipes TaxID=88211 RepID=A0AAE1FM74_PETCI|nr:hypothetical protein Pcinc_018602 [Petrolisthes cinctipes]